MAPKALPFTYQLVNSEYVEFVVKEVYELIIDQFAIYQEISSTGFLIRDADHVAVLVGCIMHAPKNMQSNCYLENEVT